MTSDSPRVARVTAGADDAGRRLDNFLLNYLRGVPRARVYRMVRSGEVRVNGGRVQVGYRLRDGDDIRVPPVWREAVAAAGPVSRIRAGWLDERVLFEDERLLVINKPAGLAVHGGSGVSLGAIELLRGLRGTHAGLELVHRLDRDTSGCLMIAKRSSALRNLHEQFRSGHVDKRYLALLVGRWPGRARTVDVPLVTDERRGGERHVRVDSAGKPAVTHFIPLERYPAAALMQVRLDTGRTHQIRVHAASIGHPVAGDPRYGLPDEPLTDRCGLKRMFLHAQSITFDSPLSGEPVTVEAPLDAELQSVLDFLRAGGLVSEERDAAPAEGIREPD